MGRARRVAIAVKTWSGEESVFVWNWARKYFVQTGRDRDWLYIVHINNGKIKGDWRKSGPTIPDLDRALQAYSYDIVELQGDSVAGSLVAWTASEEIDVLIVGSGKSGLGRRLPNPIQNRTTDHIAANATCATLVIHPKMSLADLTRCHNEQEGRDPAATGLGSQRRVAYADESQEGINSLMSWAATMVSRPDDIELQVLINRNSMLARVTEIIRPATRRRGGGSGGTSGGGGHPSPSADTPAFPSAAAGLVSAEPNAVPAAATAGDAAVADMSAPLGSMTLGEEGGYRARSVLKGKPSAVIKRFVTDNNIDMLVIPVTAQPVLRRMDKESKRDLRPTKSFVYHKAQCTCLCVPVVKLRGDPGPPAISSGLLLSEDDGDDDLDARSARLPPAPSSPTAATELHMRHMEPHINPDLHLPSAQAPLAVQTPPAAQVRPASPPIEPGNSLGNSSPPPVQSVSLRDYLPSAGSLPPSQPGASALAGSSGPLRPRRISAGSLTPSPAQPAPAPGTTGPVTAAAIAATSAAVAANGAMSSADRSPGGDDGGSGSSGGIFSTLRSRVSKLPFRKDTRETPAQTQTQPLPPTDPELVALDETLADLLAVLQEGGLSGEVRARGAEAVRHARSAISSLSAESSALRARLEEEEDRRGAAVAALIGGGGEGSGRDGTAGGGGCGDGGGRALMRSQSERRGSHSTVGGGSGGSIGSAGRIAGEPGLGGSPVKRDSAAGAECSSP
eukprot:jgi/Ulvmu1/5531/UM023_0067.1